MTLAVRAITADQHAEWVSTRAFTSFLQVPEWGAVKTGWRHESLGWFEGARLIGAGLVLYRPVPRLPQRSLAYLPEGPDIDWLRREHPHLSLDAWLEPLLDHCRSRGAFQVKMGPPVATRRWETPTIKAALAARQEGLPGAADQLSAVPADWISPDASAMIADLRQRGWSQQVSTGAGFGDVQPRFVFQVPLANRTLNDVFAGFNQLWRRNIRKAEKVGVQVRVGSREDLADFHRVYVETAARDHFTPRSLDYFQRMWDALNSRTERMRLYCADYQGHLAAATIMVTVGKQSWYSYGASTTADRDARPSNALQWQMMQDAHAMGSAVYDLRGIANTLDPDHHLSGLVQFKVGTGGYAQEYAGEWDRELRPVWAKAFRAYQSRRG